MPNQHSDSLNIGRARPQPIRRTWRALVRGFHRVDSVLQRPHVRPIPMALSTTTLALVFALVYVWPWFEFVVNRSESLPGTLFVLDKSRAPACGDTTAFDMPTSETYYRGSRLIKIVKGCAGDTVTVVDRQVFINGESVGTARAETGNGLYQLYPIEPSVIPSGFVYLSSTHEDSFDARYRSFGLRKNDELLGTAYRVF